MKDTHNNHREDHQEMLLKTTFNANDHAAYIYVFMYLIMFIWVNART